MDNLDLLIACVKRLRGRNITVTDDSAVDFDLDDIPAFARIQSGGRIRGSAFIAQLDEPGIFDDALSWASTQSRPMSSRLDVAHSPGTAIGEGKGVIRVLFERPLDPFAISNNDPLFEEVGDLFDAWHCRRGALPAPPWGGQAPYQFVDPVDIPPTNAWLLIGDDGSYPQEWELEDARADGLRGIYESTWTAAKQTEPGDLLLYYFTEPRKAIHFAARSADNAHFQDVGDTGSRYGGRQWWVHTSAPIEIEPITLHDLQDVIGPTVMRGKSGHYLRPEHAAALMARIQPSRAEHGDELSRVLASVVGRAEHPDPETIDPVAWRQLAAGSFPREAHVERFVVEPLLRWITEGTQPATVQKAYRVGHGVADYAVVDPEGPRAVVEVKLRIRRSGTGPWTECKDFLQVRRYMEGLRCPGLLIDATSIHLIQLGADEPFRSIARREVTDADLEAIIAHVSR